MATMTKNFRPTTVTLEKCEEHAPGQKCIDCIDIPKQVHRPKPVFKLDLEQNQLFFTDNPQQRFITQSLDKARHIEWMVSIYMELDWELKNMKSENAARWYKEKNEDLIAHLLYCVELYMELGYASWYTLEKEIEEEQRVRRGFFGGLIDALW